VLALPAEPPSVRTARHCVADIVTYWGLDADARAAAELVVGELAGNAARHGRSEMAIRLTSRDGGPHLTVRDSGRPRRERRRSGDGGPDEHGRGLPIVRSLAQSAVFSRGPCGWRVDVVLRLPDP
jgi:anti-sigma regulatory factor (Ser/Thr protein kinase)